MEVINALMRNTIDLKPATSIIRALHIAVKNAARVKYNVHSRDMVTDIPALIEYLTSFMTLAPGDVILTGTPEGVVNVNVGDEVVSEIEGLGRLVNTIVGDESFGRA